MNTQKNPFPGMNPFLEGHWPDVHTRLITHVCDAIAERLPADLRVLAEEGIEVNGDDKPIEYRADLAVVEPWDNRLPPLLEDATAPAVAVAEPEIISTEPLPHRWIEILTPDDRLVTVIEIISPSNKIDPGRATYLRKQQCLLASGVNLLEIDLLRSGTTLLIDELLSLLRRPKGTRYLVLGTRAVDPWRREVYYCPLRERLPAVRVPLRRSDPDIPLDLQPLIDRVYVTGRYWKELHKPIPDPPLPVDDEQWVREKLREAEQA